jgi:hypothetical protein
VSGVERRVRQTRKPTGWSRIDPGVVSLVTELRGHERQTAEELGRWKTGVEE